MVNRTSFTLLALCAGVAMLAPARAQQNPKARTLTAADYIEIQQLVARYAYAVDMHGGDGSTYADLFASDGVFGQTKGRDQLAELARRTQAERSGPAYVRHFLTNVIITPSPEGATGKQYLVAIDVGEDGKSSSVVHGGHYDDVYVKTPSGWRFKSRTYIRSELGPRQ
jgi:SnoaL-like domain